MAGSSTGAAVSSGAAGERNEPAAAEHPMRPEGSSFPATKATLRTTAHPKASLEESALLTRPPPTEDGRLPLLSKRGNRNINSGKEGIESWGGRVPHPSFFEG